MACLQFPMQHVDLLGSSRPFFSEMGSVQFREHFEQCLGGSEMKMFPHAEN